MGWRGRRNVVELTVVTGTVEPPQPPEEFSDAKKEAWRTFVKAMPPDWFRTECLPLLGQLCCHIVLVKELNARMRALIDRQASDMEIKRVANLRAQETKAVEQLSVKLRLTPTARYWPEKAITAKKRAGTKKPWEE